MPTLISKSGNVRKMRSELASPVRYRLPLSESELDLNPLIGEMICLRFAGRINCVVCDRLIKKSFAQGFCFPCFQKSPENSECIIRPVLCRGHLGDGRDSVWEAENHVQDHFVYLAVSSAVKVGVTRGDQIPTRWIDQGASAAMRFALTPNRYLAGCIEVAVAEQITDRTNWQRMLKNEVLDDVDLPRIREELAMDLDENLRAYVSSDSDVVRIHYPVQRYPQEVKSVGFDKLPEIEGCLSGIKGQYLIFDDGRVLNMRKHSGYWIEVTAGSS